MWISHVWWHYKILRWCAICAFLIGSLHTSAQNKYEKESHVKKSVVPEPALNIISKVPFDHKVKWYKEEGLNHISYEAKTKYRSRKYSIEFDDSGMLEDVEIKIKAQEVPAQTLKAIKMHLTSKFVKHKICKIQIQYSGDSDAVISAIVQDEPSALVVTRYEIVAKVKDESGTHLMEFLFSDQGSIMKRLLIVQKNTDILEY